MTKPSAREIREVSKIELLTEQDVKTLYMILQALGFDIEIMALFAGKSEAEIRKLFRVDQTTSNVGDPRLTGADLAWWCELVAVRPAVMQQKLHFDESPIGTFKIGRKSRPKRRPWIGPPMVALEGSVTEGRAFCTIAQEFALPTRSCFAKPMLAQIAAGKHPVRLPAWRDALAVVEQSSVSHDKLPVLHKVLAAFPKGARTPEEVLEILTADKELDRAESQSVTQSKPKEVQTVRGHEITEPFQAEFARCGGQVHLQQLAAAYPELLERVGISLASKVLFPGELEVLLRDPTFVQLEGFAEAKQALHALGKWVEEYRLRHTQQGLQAEQKMAVSDTSTSPIPAKPKLAEPQPSKQAEQPSKGVRPHVHQAKGDAISAQRRKEVPKSTATPTQPKPPQSFKDEFGLVWDVAMQRVYVGSVQLPLTKPPDPRLAADVQTAQLRLYRVLDLVRKRQGKGWEDFLAPLRLNRLWISGLFGGDSLLTAELLLTVKNGLQSAYDLDLTPEQLFGLAALPVSAEAVAACSTAGEITLAFAATDKQACYRWARLLARYRAVRKWFGQHYGLTDQHLQDIENGKIGVPLTVHHVLLWKVRERLDRAPEAIVPRSYQWFLKQSTGEVVENGTFVLDEQNIPNPHWLQGQ